MTLDLDIQTLISELGKSRAVLTKKQRFHLVFCYPYLHAECGVLSILSHLLWINLSRNIC